MAKIINHHKIACEIVDLLAEEQVPVEYAADILDKAKGYLMAQKVTSTKVDQNLEASPQINVTQLEEDIVDGQIIDLLKHLKRSGAADRETHHLVRESINAFSELLELWEFALEKGWSAEKLIQLTNIISALRK